MDANERLKFINRLSSLTGDQSREALKQMAINCNTKQTTIARALRNAVDQHAPVQYLAPVAVQPIPHFATPSTTASSKNKVKARDKGKMSDGGEEGGDDAEPSSKKQKKHSKKRGDINQDPNIGRLILEKSSSKMETAQDEGETDEGSRRGALPSKNGKEDKKSPTTDKTIMRRAKRDRIKEESVIVIDSDRTTPESETSDSESSDDDNGGPVDGETNHDTSDNGTSDDDSSDNNNSPSSGDSDHETSDMDSSDSDSSDSEQPIDEGLAEAGSLTVTRKRKAEEHVQFGHTNAGLNVQENKKARTTECERPVEDRTCRNCLEVFKSRAHLFRHLYSLKHFDITPTKPLSVPENQPGIQQRADHNVDMDIKKESDDQLESPSTSIRNAKPVRDIPKAMAPPAFIKEPNNFLRGPTPAPIVLARQRSNDDDRASRDDRRVRPGGTFASGVHTLRPAQPSAVNESFRPQWAANTPSNTAGEQEFECRFCHEYFKRSQNHANACRRHKGEWVMVLEGRWKLKKHVRP